MRSSINIKLNQGFKILALGLLLMIVSCGSSREARQTERSQNYQELKDLVNSREFEIQNNWAMPLGAGQINLIGNPNFIRFKGDSVNIFLPYFGVRHSGGGYGRNGGIEYEGPVSRLEIQENEGKENIVLKFRGDQEANEDLQFMITLSPNGNAYTNVNTSQRQTISYRGEIGKLPEEKE